MKCGETARADFFWRGRQVTIQAPDEDFISKVASLIGLDAQRGDGAGRLWRVEATESDWVVQWDRAIRRCATRDDALALSASWLAGSRFRDGELCFLHGGAIARDGGVDLFIGDRTSGKSSLALACWLDGHELLGDDWLVVHPEDGMVEAAPKPMRIRLPEGALPDRLAALAANGGHVGWIIDERSLLIGRNQPGVAPLDRRYPIRSLTMLTRTGPGGATRLRPMEKAGLVIALIRQTHLIKETPLSVLRPFETLLQNGRVWRLEIGDGSQDEARRLILAAP
jgi:hypothetical protein